MDIGKGHPYEASNIHWAEVGVLAAMTPYVNRWNEVRRNWPEEIKLVRK